MTLSWKELVCHGLLAKIGEPSLVKDLLKMTMKIRRDYLEEEARKFHSGNVEPVLKWFRMGWLMDEGISVPMSQFEEGQEGYRPLHSKVVDELISNWKERIPEQRRKAVMMNKETCLRARSSTMTAWAMADVRKQYPTLVKNINWYGGIHEGRYYLFWDKQIGKSISDAAKRRKQQRSFLMSGFDINIIDGEGLYRRVSDTWIYAFNQWCVNPGGWGARQSEFTMVHVIGKKEKMHIDDMFH